MPSRRLVSRWRDDWIADLRTVVRPAGLGDDLVAAATVACVAVPLSMAIALASDVAPIHGVMTAVVGGLVAAAFGSSRLSVTGPAAAMAVLVGQLVDTYGLSGLAFVTLLAGAMQIATGALGFGALARLVPSSVIHGFTAGIGVVILVGQLPRALGLPAPDESHAFAVLTHVGSLVTDVNPAALGLASVVAVVMLFGPRLSKRTPHPLVGVGLATIAAVLLRLDVPRVGALPSISALVAPGLPSLASLPALVGDAFAVFTLASLETLLSVSSLEKLRPGEKHDPNHELVGQGLGNMAAALVGGLPVTGVIARSALNVQAGARTRRASMLHAVFVGLALVLGRPLLAVIPVAALGGVLVAVGIRMLDVGHLRELWKNHRSDAVIFLVTASVMVAFDLLVGVQAGIVAACVVTLLRLTRTSVRFVPAHREEPHHVLMDGTLTFLSIPKIDTLANRLADADVAPGLVVDLRHVEGIDETVAESLAAVLSSHAERGGRVVVFGPRADVERALRPRLSAGVDVALTDADVDAQLGRARRSSGRRRIAEGLARYRREVRPRIHPLASRLAAGQAPHTMLITCADSRVVPSMITGAGPGELFVVRNIGALLPPFGSETLNDEGAALEYAIRVLGVRHVIVCGHSKCGAMTALCRGGLPDDLHALRNWAEGAHAIAGVTEGTDDVDEATKRVALRQLDNLRSYPVVAQGLGAEEVDVAAWFFDVEAADVLQWDPVAQTWASLSG